MRKVRKQHRPGVTSTRPSSAWLLLWEWSGAHAALEDQVAAVLPYRWGQERVEGVMWLLYHLRTSTLADLHEAARRKTQSIDHPRWHMGVGHLGAQPALAALPVKKLRVETDAASGLETLHFTLPTLYRGRPDLNPPIAEVVRGPLPQSISRTRTGPLSHRRAGG